MFILDVDRIKAELVRRKWSIPDLARMLLVHSSYMQGILVRKRVRLSTASKIASALNVDLTEVGTFERR